jgi:hypothetical protein
MWLALGDEFIALETGQIVEGLPKLTPYGRNLTEPSVAGIKQTHSHYRLAGHASIRQRYEPVRKQKIEQVYRRFRPSRTPPKPPSSKTKLLGSGTARMLGLGL